MRPDDAPTSARHTPAPRGAGSRSLRRLPVVAGLIATAATALAACGSSGNGGSGSVSNATGGLSGLYGKLPPVGTPKKGGTITFGQLTGSTPTYIFPIVPSANSSVYDVNEFLSNLFLPLYNGPNGKTPEINYALSLATKPTFSNGDKTVTIPMKKGFKWSDGKPVVGNDLIFEIDLLKAATKESAANWSSFTPGQFPDSVVSAKTTDPYTVVLTLNKPYNPGFFLNNQLQNTDNVVPLPSTAWNIASAGGPHLDYTNPANAKKIYDYLSKAGGQVAKFATDPLWKVVDGPFSLKSFSATNSSYTLVPNPSYGGSPKAQFDTLSVQTYTGITPQLNALRTGSLDIAQLDFSQLGQIGSLKSQGYNIYGYPDFGFFAAFFNFKDTTNHFDKVIGQLYARQALAHLEDQNAYVSGIFKGAAVPAYGPVPSVPATPFTPPNAVKAPYPYDPAAAVSLLKSHGWNVVPNGQTTCAKAGSGPGQCGPGIPAGTPFKFTWFYIPPSTTPSSALESEAFASEAKKAAGINIELHQKTFNFLVQNYNDADPSDNKFRNDWGVNNFGGFTNDYWPTSNTVFNTTGVYNTGAYSDPTADKLINNSVYSGDPTAVTKEASYLAEQVPGLFTPNSEYVYAVSKRVGGDPSSWYALTQLTALPQFWYLTK